MAKKPFTPIPPMAELPTAEEINAKDILDKYLNGEIDLICVLGPTASGKTRYAVQLARQINSLLEEIPLSLSHHTQSTVVEEGEKRATPLAAGGGTRDAVVGGVLFDSSTTVQGDGNEIRQDEDGEKRATPLAAGGGTRDAVVGGVLFESSTTVQGDGDEIRQDEDGEKRATPLAAGGGTRDAVVGGVLFESSTCRGNSEEGLRGDNEEGHRRKGGAEIISADSRQVYRGMDIGTGKDLNEYEEIPYHLMDIVDAGEKYNIFEYQRDFEKAYKSIVERGGIPILCGGSGLYIEAATCGYSLPEVPPDPELRAELEKESDEVLIKRLAELKPLHNSTDYDTRKRLIRALEIAIYEAEHPVQRTAFLPKNTYYIGTLVSRETRNARIDKRLDARLEEGMVDEIRRLMEGTNAKGAIGGYTEGGPIRKIPAEDLIYYGLEYKFVTLYLIGELTYDQMREQLATAIHQFAKRQMTWFRGMERKGITIHWTAV